MLGNSLVAEQLAASQEDLSSMELVSLFVEPNYAVSLVYLKTFFFY
jgi:hypothetical protein